MTDLSSSDFPVWAPRKGGRFLPRKESYLELSLFFGAFCAVGLWGNDLASLLGVKPHPFWLPVILLSLQYGVVDGLLAASVSIAVLWLNGWPEQQFNEEYFDFWMRVWLTPALWVMTALIVGGIRQRQIDDEEALALRLERTQAQAMELCTYANRLSDKVDQLERHIASGSDQHLPHPQRSESRDGSLHHRWLVLPGTDHVVALVTVRWLGNHLDSETVGHRLDKVCLKLGRALQSRPHGPSAAGRRRVKIIEQYSRDSGSKPSPSLARESTNGSGARKQ